MKKQIIAWAVLAVLATTWAYTYASSTWTTSATKTQIMDIVKKVREWVSLTSDEQATYDAVQAKRQEKTWSGETMWGGRWMGPGEGRMGMMWEWRWMGMWMIQELTDEEKTKLESMTDEEKKAFFETKRSEAQAKQTAKENVIDKLLAGQTLSSSEETVRAEIIKERADMKAKKAKMEAIKTIMDKKRNGETLSTDEQAQLDKFEANKPKMDENFSKMWKRWNHEFRNQTNSWSTSSN